MGKSLREYQRHWSTPSFTGSNLRYLIGSKNKPLLQSIFFLVRTELDLAKEAGVSPSLIQDLRSGKKDNLTFKSFSHIVEALGYDNVHEKRNKRSHISKLRMASQRRIPRNKRGQACDPAIAC